MDTSTLRSAAGTVTDRVADLAQTVGDVAPDVTNKIGETAMRLAALTPWVEEAAVSRRSRRWLVAIALVVAGAALATWLRKRRCATPAATSETDVAPVSSRPPDRRLATAGN